MTKEKKYRSPNSCNKCSGETDLKVVDRLEHIVLEYYSTCKECGFVDRWVTGFWESGSEIVSNCNKY